MDDKLYEEMRARVETALAYWRPLLRLDDWQIEVNYLRVATPGNGLMLAVTSKWQYEHALMDVYCTMIQTRTAAELDADVLHELVHLLVAPMGRDDADLPSREQTALEELAVTHVTRAILQARDARELAPPESDDQRIAAAMRLLRTQWPPHAELVEHTEGAYSPGCQRCLLEQSASELNTYEILTGAFARDRERHRSMAAEIRSPAPIPRGYA